MNQADEVVVRGRTGIKKRVLLLALCVALLGGGLTWLRLPGPNPDPLFRGKPESVWIESIDYNGDENQTAQWRDFGAEGVRVLIRGLERADRPVEKAYRKSYRRFAPRLPRVLIRWFPAPKSDSTRASRMCILALLRKLGPDAYAAEPAVARALEDEDIGVRQLAIPFFTSSEDEKALLNLLPAKEKKKLLPKFIRAMRDGDQGLRNNAAIALRYYPEQWEIVVPVLTNAVHDSQPNVALLSAVALNRIAPDAIASAGVLPIVIQILKNPDYQIAYQAAELLGEMTNEPSLTVPALIESLRATNALVAGYSVAALAKFVGQSDSVIPALEQAAQRKDYVGGRAKRALEQILSASRQQPGRL